MNSLGILNQLLRAALTIVLIGSGFGLIALILMGFGVSIFGWLLSRWWVLRRIPDLQLRLSLFKISRAKNLVGFSGVMFLWSIAGYAVHQLDRILIGLFLPVSTITTYEVGARLSNCSRNFLHSWLSIIMPAASGLNAMNERMLLQRLFLKGTKYLLVCYAGVTVALLGFGKEFIALWMGNEFSESFFIMSLLLIGSFYQSQNVVAHVMLPGMGNLKVFTKVMIVYPILITILGIMFIQQWGLVGMAAAIAVTMIFIETCFFFYIAKIFEISLSDLMKACHVPVIFSAIPTIVWILFIREILPPQSWFTLSIDVASCLVLYSLSFWFLGASQEERKALKAKTFDLLGFVAGRTTNIHIP
jgi:O-antigen/teichoic acid export membrane protein